VSVSRGPERMLVAVAVLVAAGFFAVASASSSDGAATARSREFQRAVGGLGLGTSLTLECPFGFDPRLAESCGQRHLPVAGGGAFCPLHKSLLP
jgi:hypothetical protein